MAIIRQTYSRQHIPNSHDTGCVTSDTEQESLTCAYSSNINGKIVYVFLYKNGDILSRSEVVYLGMLGMQVKTDPLLFPKHTHLDAVFYLDNVHGPYHCKLNAVATSRSGQGVGFTFVDCDEYAYEKLKILIRYLNDNTRQDKTPLNVNYSLIPD